MKKAFLAICSLFLTSCSVLGISPTTSRDGLLSIKLSNSKVKLTLSEKMSLTDHSTSLSIQKSYSFEENTYTALPSQDVLDNEETPYNVGEYTRENGDSVMRYLKYTFYIANIGNETADYSMEIELNESKSSDGTDRTISDTLRVMVYENDVGDDSNNGCHFTEVYAKESAAYNIDKNGNRTMREFIATYPYLNQEDDDHPLAASFINDTTIAKYERNGFNQNQVRRYTFVVWLEGEDPQSAYAEQAPANSSIKLSVNISARSN